jgi:hypothetical protein
MEDKYEQTVQEELTKLFGEAKPIQPNIANRTSLEYQQAYNEGTKVNNERKNRVDPLVESLEQAEHLDDERKAKMIEIAELYLSNMRDNIFRDQFELNENYPNVSIDEWNDFLADRIVSTYISKHKRTLLKNKAESSLATPDSKNKKDNLQLLREMSEADNRENISNIVIMRIPDVYSE